MNQSIFRPTFFRKKRKPEVPEDEIQTNYEQRRNFSDNLLSGDLGDEKIDLLGGREGTRTDQRPTRKEQYKRYQFESTASDDEMEEEISTNLDQLDEAAKRLKAIGIAMGDELKHQNEWIDNIAAKTDRLDGKLRVNTDRVRCYSKLISIFI